MSIIISKLSAVSTCLSFTCIALRLKIAQFLNATLVSTLPSAAVIFPVTGIYVSE